MWEGPAGEKPRDQGGGRPGDALGITCFWVGNGG